MLKAWVKEDTKNDKGSVQIGAKENNLILKNLSKNSNKCIVSEKVSFDDAVSNELKAYSQKLHKKLEQMHGISDTVQGYKKNVEDPGTLNETGDYNLYLKPEAVATFKALYAETKETLDYLEKFGSKREKAQAILIKSVALGSCY
jgi:hypothetical protein